MSFPSTTDEVNELLAEAEEIGSLSFMKGKSIRSSNSFKSFALAIGIDASKLTQTDSLTEIKSRLSKLPVLEMTISFAADKSLLSKIVSATKRIYGQDTVLNIKRDSFIQGGALLNYKGRHYDGSLRGRIQNIAIRI